MAEYFYKAKNLKGEKKDGVLEAEDQHQLVSTLKQQGYFLLSCKREAQKQNFFKFNFLSQLFSIPLTEKLFFTRNLTVMTRTGVSLVRAFDILACQTKNKKFKKVLIDISRKIQKGNSLSKALSFYPKIFPPLYQETVKVGEETGELEKSLTVLSEQMERSHDLKSKIKSAMVYPLVVVCMLFGIGIFMMVFAVPKIREAFVDMKIELPVTTRAILAFADFAKEKWPLVLVIIGILVVVIMLVSKRKKGGKFVSGVLLKIPIISKIVRQANSALTLRTLSSLMAAGVPIVRSLNICSGALNNFYFQESLKKAAEVVEKGEKLSKALRPYEKIYSPMVLQMMEVGEETGETADVLKKLAEFFEGEVSESTQRLSSVLEPFLMLIVGIIVGFFVVSMMQPMFGMMGGM